MVYLKKAQTEMMGLMIIVILIIVIALFALRLFLLNPNQQSSSDILSLKANNLVNAIKKATFQQDSLANQIVDCCFSSNCNQIKQEISKIILTSIEEQIYLTVLNPDNSLCFSINNSCSSDSISSTKNVLKNNNNKVFLQLFICKK